MRAEVAKCNKTTIGWVILGVLLVCGPWLLGTYYLYCLNLLLVNVILAAGLNILTGNAGQVSLCNSSFMAIGAYATMLLATRCGLWYWLALPMGGLVSAGLGLVLGLPALRLRGYYLALATLCFLEITQVVIQETPALTGGVRGMMAPRPVLAGVSLTNDLAFYYPILAITAFMVFAARNMLDSPFGRALNAIRNSEAAAQTLGIPLSQVKVAAFTVSAFYAGVAGGLYAPLVGFIDPVEFGLWTSIMHLTFIIVGGLGSVAGSVVGATLLTVLAELLSGLKEYRDLVYGGLLLCFLIFMPRGVVGIWRHWVHWTWSGQSSFSNVREKVS